MARPVQVHRAHPQALFEDPLAQRQQQEGIRDDRAGGIGGVHGATVPPA